MIDDKIINKKIIRRFLKRKPYLFPSKIYSFFTPKNKNKNQNRRTFFIANTKLKESSDYRTLSIKNIFTHISEQ